MNPNNHISQEELEAIERYLDNTMEPSERDPFELKLKENLPFRNVFEETKALLVGIESAVLEQQLKGFHEDMDNVISLPSKTKNKSRFAFISIAASIAIIMGTFWFLNSSSSTDQIFAKHFTPDPGLPTVMSATDNYDFYDAMVNYKQEEYDIAIKKWETILPTKPANDTINFYLGVSYLANGDAQKASQFFEKTMLTRSSIFIEDAYYFAALAQLKNNNVAKATELLNKSNTSQSKALLKDLNTK